MRLSVHQVVCSLAALFVLGCFASASADATVLDAIRTRGHVVCGVGDGPRGYSSVDGQGVWSGINVDFCRALAVAILGSRDAVQFRLVPAGERFTALQSREIDVLSRNVAITSSLDTTLGIRFPGVLVYDGQGFLVRKAQNVSSALELSGARVCVTTETSDTQGVADFFNGLKIPYRPAEVREVDRRRHGLRQQELPGAVGRRLGAGHGPPDLAHAGEHIILPELASKQPVGPAVRQGDEEWFSVVRWTIYALIAAEELGINSGNVDAMKTSGSSEARRFLGSDLELGKRLGLSADWTQRLIKQIGNYGELFDRNLGLKSPLRLSAARTTSPPTAACITHPPSADPSNPSSRKPRLSRISSGMQSRLYVIRLLRDDWAGDDGCCSDAQANSRARVALTRRWNRRAAELLAWGSPNVSATVARRPFCAPPVSQERILHVPDNQDSDSGMRSLSRCSVQFGVRRRA